MIIFYYHNKLRKFDNIWTVIVTEHPLSLLLSLACVLHASSDTSHFDLTIDSVVGEIRENLN
jgi:hypothetical protein